MTRSITTLAALAMGLLVACSQATHKTSTSGTSATALDTVAAAVASATAATGTLLCAPSQAQLDACSGLAAGDACTLTLANGTTTVDGTCRSTLDGASIGCAPNPPAPPRALVDACAGLAAGDTCTAAEPDGDTHGGVCVTARNGATLICGRAHVPPQAAIDACASSAAGDACSMPCRDGTSTVAGVCSYGPAGTGVLACAPPQALRPSATAACAGLAAGADCTIGDERHATTGTCVTPAQGGDAVCVPACADLGGRFDCGPGGGPGGPGMPGGPGHH